MTLRSGMGRRFSRGVRAASGGVAAPAVSWLPLVVDYSNVTATQFSLSNASGYVFYTYSITSSAGGGADRRAVTGSGTIAGGTTIAADVSPLPDGSLTLSVTLLGANGAVSGPYTSSPIVKASFPTDISSLVRAWRFDSGVTSDGTGIYSVSGAWGTSTPATQTQGDAKCPSILASGPLERGISNFSRAQNDFLSFASIDLTACTAFIVAAPKTYNADQYILARDSAGSNFGFKASAGAATPISQFTARTGNPTGSTAGAATTLSAPRTMTKSLNVIEFKYDTTSTNIITCIDGVDSAATAIGNHGMTFNRIGVGGAASATNPTDMYLSALLICNAVLPDADRGRVRTYLEAEFNTRLRYVSSASGNDANLGWSPSQAWQTIDKACGDAVRGHEVIALKGGDLFRPTASAVLPLGQSLTRRPVLDGGYWGTGLADVRASTTPALTLESGTIYSFASASEPFGTATPAGVGYQYVVTGAGLEDVTRLKRTSGTQTAPASGEWGWVSGKVYVNSGGALTGTPIEVPLAFSFVNAGTNNQQYRNMWVRFSYGSAGVKQGGATGIDFTNIYASYHCADGIDHSGSNAHICTVNGCYASYCGRLPTSGNSDGDGYSAHGTVDVTFNFCIAFMNDKAGFNHVAGTLIRHNSCLSIGNQPFATPNNAGAAGIFEMNNCIGTIPASVIASYGAELTDDGYRNNYTAQTVTVKANNSTFVLEAASAGSRGIFVGNGAATIYNTIMDGFAAPAEYTTGGSGIEDYNLRNCASNAFVGAAWTSGGHSITGDPLFTNRAGRDYSLQSGSPAKNAGVVLTPALLADYRGFPRPYGAAPDIGAHERQAA